VIVLPFPPSSLSGHATRKPLPDIAQLREAIEIDPATGRMTWKVRPLSHFRTAGAAATWNKQFPGTPAFSTLIRGYLHGIYNGARYRANRVAFALYTGRDPGAYEVDHIDGDRINNAENNLREVTSAENKRNLAIPAHNSSGAIGVSFSKTKKKWRAYIGVGDQRQSHLGYFTTEQEAKAARRTAEAQLGFHDNHGRSA